MAKKQRQTSSKRGAAEPDVYPHSPLAEVVFELRFKGELAIECHRDEYFATIRREFPTVLVPTAEIGKAPAIQPYQFKSEDGIETIMVAIDRFAYSTRRYPGFSEFKRSALRLAKSFCERFGIRVLNRMGLRYINIIPFVRDSGSVPWKQFFTVEMNLPLEAANNLTNANIAYEAKCDDGAITTRIGCRQSPDTTDEAFVLDFDFAKTKNISAAKLPTAIRVAHDYTKRVFHGIVSEQYKAVMRGEVIA